METGEDGQAKSAWVLPRNGTSLPLAPFAPATPSYILRPCSHLSRLCKMNRGCLGGERGQQEADQGEEGGISAAVAQFSFLVICIKSSCVCEDSHRTLAALFHGPPCCGNPVTMVLCPLAPSPPVPFLGLCFSRAQKVF